MKNWYIFIYFMNINAYENIEYVKHIRVNFIKYRYFDLPLIRVAVL